MARSRHPSQSRPPSSAPKSGEALGSVEEYFVDVILNRHARKLLAAMRLRDLGLCSAYLDFKLQAWLTKERWVLGSVNHFTPHLSALRLALIHAPVALYAQCLAPLPGDLGH